MYVIEKKNHVTNPILRMNEQDNRLLPIANVGRIMKQILPPNAKVSKEAKERMQECATEFIGFVTSEASNKCHKENRKTVNGDDVCWALSSVGLDNYSDVTAMYLSKYREYERKRANENHKATEAPSSSEERLDEGICNYHGCSSVPSFGFQILDQ